MGIAINTNRLRASILKDDYESFVRHFWDVIVPERLVWNWHMTEICKMVQELLERVMAGLPCDEDGLINVPPGSSKSLLASVMPMPFIWARDPSFKFICASHSYELAMDLSRKSRQIVLSDQYQKMFPHVQLALDQNTKHLFATTRGGFRYATSCHGSVIGKHAHAIILDDIVDPKKVQSPAELLAANNWVSEEVSTRKVDKVTSLTMLIMQRLGIGDPAQVMIDKGHVRKLILPGESGFPIYPEEFRDRYIDKLLDPKRLPWKVLEKMKTTLGKYGYAGQIGQSPLPQEGGMFITDNFRRDYPMPKCTRFVRFWDKAGTLAGGNWTSGVLMGATDDNRFCVLDVKRFQLDSWSRDELILATAKEDGKETIIGLEQEGGSGGKQSVEISLRKMAGFSIRTIRPNRHQAKGGKAGRADPWSTQVNGRNVWMAFGKWNFDFVEEHRYFPFGRSDDIVDAAVGAFTIIAQPLKRRVGGMSPSNKYMNKGHKVYS